MLVRELRSGSRLGDGYRLSIIIFLCLVALVAITAAPISFPRAAPAANLRTSVLPAPPSASQFGFSLNGTEGNTGWYRSDIIMTLFYIGNVSNAYFEYSVDGAPWQRYADPFLISGDGHHLVNVTLWENGSRSVSMRGYFDIDSVNPQSVFDLGAARETNGWFNASPEVRLAGSDSLSGLGELEYRMDNGTWQNYSFPMSLPDGIHSFDYRAVDVAGNEEPLHSRAFQIDSVGPTVYGLSSDVYREREGHVAWHAVDTLSGIAGYAVSVDGGPFTRVGLQEGIDFSLPDGTHRFDVQAFDTAGNMAVLDFPIRVDTNPFSYTGPFQGVPTYLVILAAAIVVRLVWMRQMRRMGPG